jgi:hypothetical protein
MKTGISTMLTAAGLSMLPALACASTGGRVDHSPLVIWVFLGFCALIVIAQVIPAILNARRAAAAEREARKKEAASTYR